MSVVAGVPQVDVIIEYRVVRSRKASLLSPLGKALFHKKAAHLSATRNGKNVRKKADFRFFFVENRLKIAWCSFADNLVPCGTWADQSQTCEALTLQASAFKSGGD